MHMQKCSTWNKAITDNKYIIFLGLKSTMCLFLPVCPGMCAFAILFMCVSTSLLQSDIPSANPGPPQTCGPEKGLFVSAWDRLATSALLAPPQALADLQIPEPGQALHLCSPPQTKRPLQWADPSLSFPTDPSPFITNWVTTVRPAINVDINTFHWSKWDFPQVMHDFLLNYVIYL